MSGKHWTQTLIDLDACTEAVEWAKGYGTFDEAWRASERGDWMMWLVGKFSGLPDDDKRKPLVLAACKCARLALKYVPAREVRPQVAIETAERWAKGGNAVTIGDVCSAAYAADRRSILKKCADIVRKHYPTFELEQTDER
jgi:hypothetical protein